MAEAATRRVTTLSGHLETKTVGVENNPCAASTRIPPLNIPLMTQLLDSDNFTSRARVKELLKEPVFEHRFNMTKEEYRELTLARCKRICESGVFSIRDYKGDVLKYLSVLEVLSGHDCSLTIKMGVQFNLWGGSVLNLSKPGQAIAEKLLPLIDTLDAPGCFAMTELGHGSNVAAIETSATFDKKKQEFIIHTPTETAQKYWIGNAAKHGKWATVFAQLILDGRSYGVHTFVVRIRNEDMTLCPGVRIKDNGDKMGLNGVDNGRLWFDKVRIPREHMLSKLGEVKADGTYESEYSDPGRRFAAHLAELVGGRVAIACGSIVMCRVGLCIAIRYAHERIQFGPSTGETPIMRLTTHQLRLIPLLASTIGMQFACNMMKRKYSVATPGDKEVHALAAGLKAVATWHMSETLQTCREACGGQGFSAHNRIGPLKTDADIYLTFEGDNTVLVQQVTKYLLGEMGKEFRGKTPLQGALTIFGRQIEQAARHKNPMVIYNGTERHLRDFHLHKNAFAYRETTLLFDLAACLRSKRRGQDFFDVWNANLDTVVHLGIAHTERVILEEFQMTVKMAHPDLRPVLRSLCALYALHRIEKDLGWFMSCGYFSPYKARAIHHQIVKLCRELCDHTKSLVDAFDIPDHILGAPIGLDYIAHNTYGNAKG